MFALVAVAILTGYVLAIWHAPTFGFLVDQEVLGKTAPEQRLPAEHNARLIVISAGGALVVGIGLLYTARNYRLAHRGQVTERFTKALERLGSDELYIRIGGINALEHVMRDSPDHHGDVVEVLVAFIRDRVPRRVVESTSEARWMHPPIGTEVAELPDEPTPDVQAALTALCKRPHRAKQERNPINFRQLHLKGARLEDARLESADLSGAQLQRARLNGAQLRRANLTGAQLQQAHLTKARLQNANLTGTQLQRAHLADARLQNAHLNRAQLQDAHMRRAQLQHAHLQDAQLQDAYLVDAQLQDADLHKAQLQRADMRDAQLQRADFWEAQIQGANMWGANRKDACPPNAVSGGWSTDARPA